MFAPTVKWSFDLSAGPAKTSVRPAGFLCRFPVGHSGAFDHDVILPDFGPPVTGRPFFMSELKSIKMNQNGPWR